MASGTVPVLGNYFAMSNHSGSSESCIAWTNSLTANTLGFGYFNSATQDKPGSTGGVAIGIKTNVGTTGHAMCFFLDVTGKVYLRFYDGNNSTWGAWKQFALS